MRRLLVALFLIAAWSASALAQNIPVFETGTITPGHPAKFLTNGVIGDAGGAAGGPSGSGFTELGITNTGTPFCVTDAPITSLTGYHQLCLGANALGGGLVSYQAYGGASPLPLSCNINGTVYSCFPTGGNVVAPTSPFPVAGNAVIWNGGTTVADAGAPPGLQVPTIAALAALPLTHLSANSAVSVNGYWSEGSAPRVTYFLQTSACSLNFGLGDGGSQIPSNTAGNCWNISPQTIANVLNWGASGSSLSAHLTINSGSLSGTLDNAEDFIPGEQVVCLGCGTANALTAPSITGVTNTNGSGSTSYSYLAVPIDSAGAPGPASTVGTNASGPTSLNVAGTNVQANGQAVALSGTYTAVAIYAFQSGVTYALAGTTISSSYNDYGSGSYVDNVPRQLPATITTGYTGTADPQTFTIKSIVGTTITFTGASTTTCSSCVLTHNDTVPLNNATAYGVNTYLPQGQYNITSPLTYSTQDGQIIEGCGLECAVVWDIGTMNVVSPNSSATDQVIEDISFSMQDATAGNNIELNSSPFFYVNRVSCDQCYNGIDMSNIGGSSFLQVSYYRMSTQVNGQFEIGAFSPSTTKQGIAHFDHITTPNSCFHCVGILIDGDVPTMDFEYTDIQETITCVQISNASGAPQPPDFIAFVRLGCNGTWGRSVSITAGTNIVFTNSFLQSFKGGSQPVFDAGPNVTNLQVQGGIITGGGVGALITAATDITLSGVRMPNGIAGQAAIECASGGSNMTIDGGGDTNTQNGQTTWLTGIQLDNGCVPGQSLYTGIWWGTAEDMLNNSALPTAYDGLPMGTNFINDQTSGSDTFLVATGLYTGIPTSVMQRNGGSSPWTDHVDSAANIEAAILGTAYVGQQFTFYIKNEGAHTMTLAHDTGSTVTISGTATIASEAISRFLCVVTGITPSQAITCVGHPGAS